MGYIKTCCEVVEVMEECAKPFIIHIYAEGHLLDIPNVSIYLGKYAGKKNDKPHPSGRGGGQNYLVINSITRYPISVADKEVVALTLAKARKVHDVRKAIVTRILKIDTNLWNWGDIFLVEQNNELYPVSEPQTFNPKSFKQILSDPFDLYSNDICTISFDSCERFPLYANLELCTHDGFHYYVLKQLKTDTIYVVQSPTLFERYHSFFFAS